MSVYLQKTLFFFKFISLNIKYIVFVLFLAKYRSLFYLHFASQLFFFRIGVVEHGRNDICVCVCFPSSSGGREGGGRRPSARCQRERPKPGRADGRLQVAETAAHAEISDEVLPRQVDHRQYHATRARYRHTERDTHHRANTLNSSTVC